MKKIFLVLVIVFAFGIKANAQDSNDYYAVADNGNNKFDVVKNEMDYIKFNSIQKKKARSISTKKLKMKANFGSGIIYNGKFYWWVLAKNGKTHYFRSDTNFSNIKSKQTTKGSLKNVAREDNF